jgi:opacity protein-like surface antigen
MEMRKLLLSAMLCLFFLSGFSQKFLPGFIITRENDTIYGGIANQQDLISVKKCTFKNSQGEVTVFQPSDIFGYKFNDGRYYISKKLENGNLEESVFLEYLVKGVIDLYYYPSNEGDKYYILKDNNLVELANNKKSYKVNGNNYTKYDKKYIGVLKYLFKDTPEIAGRVENAKFSPGSLIKISEDYHNLICPDENCTVFKGNGKEFKMGLKLIGEYTFSTLKLNRYINSIIYRSESSSEFSYSYGLGVYMISEDGRYAIEYSIRKNQSVYANNKYSENTRARLYFDELNIDKIENRLLLNYYYIHYRLKPYVKAGIAYDFTTNYEIIGETDFDYPGQIYGIILGAGVKYSVNPKLEIDLSAQYSSLNGDGRSVITKYSDYNILLSLNYKLK